MNTTPAAAKLEQPTPEQAAKFEKILTLEDDVRRGKASVECSLTFYDRSRSYDMWQASKRKLRAAVDTLALDEMRAFGRYRSSHLAR